MFRKLLYSWASALHDLKRASRGGLRGAKCLGYFHTAVNQPLWRQKSSGGGCWAVAVVRGGGHGMAMLIHINEPIAVRQRQRCSPAHRPELGLLGQLKIQNPYILYFMWLKKKNTEQHINPGPIFTVFTEVIEQYLDCKSWHVMIWLSLLWEGWVISVVILSEWQSVLLGKLIFSRKS